jgi:hypothetical protein
MTAHDRAQLALDLGRPLDDSEDRRGCPSGTSRSAHRRPQRRHRSCADQLSFDVELKPTDQPPDRSPSPARTVARLACLQSARSGWCPHQAAFGVSTRSNRALTSEVLRFVARAPPLAIMVSLHHDRRPFAWLTIWAP